MSAWWLLAVAWPASGWIGGVMTLRCEGDFTLSDGVVTFILGMMGGPMVPLIWGCCIWLEHRSKRAPRWRFYHEPRKPIILLQERSCTWLKP